jgi:hypothetical protein
VIVLALACLTAILVIGEALDWLSRRARRADWDLDERRSQERLRAEVRRYAPDDR